MGVAPICCFRAMRKRNSDLEAMLKPVVADLGYEFWGLERLTEKGGSLLRLYIDSAAGITLADCERVSYRVAGVLDVEDPIAGAYRLEVSSPGLDRLLFTMAQYERFVGEQVKVRLSKPCESRKRIAGRLERVSERKVVLNEAGREFHIPLEDIDRARVAPRMREMR